MSEDKQENKSGKIIIGVIVAGALYIALSPVITAMTPPRARQAALEDRIRTDGKYENIENPQHFGFGNTKETKSQTSKSGFATVNELLAKNDPDSANPATIAQDALKISNNDTKHFTRHNQADVDAIDEHSYENTLARINELDAAGKNKEGLALAQKSMAMMAEKPPQDTNYVLMTALIGARMAKAQSDRQACLAMCRAAIPASHRLQNKHIELIDPLYLWANDTEIDLEGLTSKAKAFEASLAKKDYAALPVLAKQMSAITANLPADSFCRTHTAIFEALSLATAQDKSRAIAALKTLQNKLIVQGDMSQANACQRLASDLAGN